MRYFNTVISQVLFKSPCQKTYWLLIAIFVKFLFLFFFCSQDPHFSFNIIQTPIGIIDDPSYLKGIDNFLVTGHYNPDYRMPGLGVVYLLFSLFFKKIMVINLIVFFQTILGGISIYALGLIAQEISNKKIAFHLVFWVYLFNGFTSSYDHFIMTESLTTSIFIFSIYFLLQFFKRKKIVHILLSGLFLAWVIFLKPVFAPYVAIFTIVLIFYLNASENLFSKNSIKIVLIFLSPLLVCESWWVTRNYYYHKKFIPLTTVVTRDNSTDDLEYAIREFNWAWGGRIDLGDGIAEFQWFNYRIPNQFTLSENEMGLIQFPNYIYTQEFNFDSLKAIKKSIYICMNEYNDVLIKNKNYEYAVLKLNSYTTSIKNNHPLVYYIYAPVIYLKYFIFHSGSYFLFKKTYSQLSFSEKIIKIGYSALYYTIIITGLITSFLLIFKNIFKFNAEFLIASIPLYFIVIHAFVLRVVEYRYNMPAYPAYVLLACYAALNFGERIKTKFNLSTKQYCILQ